MNVISGACGEVLFTATGGGGGGGRRGETSHEQMIKKTPQKLNNCFNWGGKFQNLMNYRLGALPRGTRPSTTQAVLIGSHRAQSGLI